MRIHSSIPKLTKGQRTRSCHICFLEMLLYDVLVLLNVHQVLYDFARIMSTAIVKASFCDFTFESLESGLFGFGLLGLGVLPFYLGPAGK